MQHSGSSKVANTHVVALFRKSDRLVMHVHTTMVYEGGREVSKEEAKNEAVRQAKKSGHDVEALDVLLVEHELPRVPGILRVDKDLRNLVMEPHSSGPRAGRAVKERRKVAPPRTGRQKPPTRRKKT